MQKVHLVRQSANNECGLCCISMVASFYHYNQPISAFRERFNVGRDGLSIQRVYQIFDDINLQPTVYQLDDIYNFEFQKVPYVLYTNANHYVVVYPKGNGRFIMYDPSMGKRRIGIVEVAEISGGYAICVIPKDGFTPRNEKISEFRNVKRFFSGVKTLFIIVTVATVLAYLISVAVPMLLENVINILVYGGEIGLSQVFLILAGIIVLYFVSSHIRNIFLVRLQTKLYENVALYTVKHLLKIPYSYFDDRGEGNVLFRIGLLTQIQDMISTSFVQIIMNFVSTVVIATYLFIKEPSLIPMIILILLILGIAVILINTYMMTIKQQEMAAKEKVNGIQTEIVSNMFQIKASRLSGYFEQYFEEKFSDFRMCFEKSQKKYNLFMLLLSIFTNFAPIVVVLISICFMKEITVGALFSLYAYLNLIITYATTFFSEVSNLLMIKPSLFYLNDIYDEKEEEMDGDAKISEFNQLCVSNVRFRYNDTYGDVIKGVDLNIDRGQKIAIIGLSGSGKSTLIKLLTGLYKTNSGSIQLNGIDINVINEEFFFRRVAVVPQQATVFNKTIKENIALGDDYISDEDIYKALEAVSLLDYIQELPMGINTVISYKGANFSGGQNQRLAIARAIVKNPELLILDEATNSLDAINERLIYQNLKQMGITLLTISHRLSTVIDSDNIYVLDKGKICEEGRHDELIKNRKIYYQLYIQQEAEDEQLRLRLKGGRRSI